MYIAYDQDWPALPLCAEHSQADARVEVKNAENPALESHPAATEREEMDYDEFLATKALIAQPCGIELKPEYFNQAVKNLQNAERASAQTDLFAFAGVALKAPLL